MGRLKRRPLSAEPRGGQKRLFGNVYTVDPAACALPSRANAYREVVYDQLEM